MLPGTLFLLAHLVTLLRGRGAEAPEASPDADTWAAAIEAAYQVDIERTPTLRAAWRAGKAAGRILVATEVLARLTSLRSGVPGARGPEAELLRLAGELHAEVAAFAGVLADVGLPVVTHHAGDVARLFAAHDLTAAIPGDGGALSYVAAKLPSFFEATARRFDVPPPRFAVAPPSAVEEDLLARIWADRSADGPRHAFAALAARRDDPRAEMIRLQFALADARYAGDRAALEVQARYLALSHPEWTDRLRELGARDVVFARGFPDELTIDAEVLLTNAEELLACAPITGVRVRNVPPQRLRALVSLPWIAGVERLDLRGQRVTDVELAALAASPHVRRVRELDLGDNAITAAGVRALAASSQLVALERVALELNRTADPVDGQEAYDETLACWVRSPFGCELEAAYGRLAWLHPGVPAITPARIHTWARRVCWSSNESVSEAPLLVDPPVRPILRAVADRATNEKLDHLELALPEPGLTRSELEATLGVGELSPRATASSSFELRFRVIEARAPSTCDVIAAFAEKPWPDSRAAALTLRRSPTPATHA